MPRAKGADGPAQEIQLQTIRREQFAVKIVGVTPLLFNKFSERALDVLEGSQFGHAKELPKIRVVEEEVREKLHICDDGRYGCPADAIHQAAATAAYRVGVSSSIVKPLGMFSIPVSLIPIDGPEPTALRSWVRLANGSPMTVYRPQFWPWQMVVPIVYIAGPISVEAIVNMLNLAGSAVGIGAWRIEKRGNYGQFRVEE